MKRNINETIRDFNEGRYPETLKMKYEAMRADSYRFLRATTHLFYEDIPNDSFLFDSPNAWICGDLHLENLGSYKGDIQVAYFNVNDFDESLLGPILFDIYRLLTSIYVSASNLNISLNQTHTLCREYVDTYFNTLEKGYIRVLEKQTARGVIKRFLKQVNERKEKDFLKKRVYTKKGKDKLIIDKLHTLPITDEKKEEVKKHINEWINNPDSHKMIANSRIVDLAFRIAGTSSLGLERYVLLASDVQDKSKKILLDLKETTPSCILKYIHVKQPAWEYESERLIEIQRRMLSDPPALLQNINFGNKNFVLKELQPTADRIDYTMFHGNLKKLRNMLEDMASICAWDNLRSSGRQGSAIADELILFARSGKSLKKAIVDAAYAYSKTVLEYHKSFCSAFDKGYYRI